MNIDKIGMYKTDEILEFMAEGEGRGFLGRSMFDAMYFEIERLNNIINEFENRDDVLEEFEDWLERQKTRNSEWDNFIMVDGRLGIPISYLLNKLQELKGEDKE